MEKGIYKHNLKSKVFLPGLIIVLILSTIPQIRANAADGKGTASYNLHNHNYRYGTWYSQWNWAEVSKSYMYAKDGKPVRVEALSDKVIVEFFSPEFNLLSSKTIDFELPIFGGFFCGKDAVYLMFGQQNDEESDSCEVVRIVKYDFSWNRIASVSYKGINTYIPFDGGASDFAEYGDILYVRTCHEMYKSSDGRNHQANMTFAVNTSNMTAISSFTKVMNINYGYSSHSFNQFIRIDDDKIVAVDHGDAHPRSVVLGQYPSNASSGRVDERGYKNVNLAVIPGNTGANFTGTSVGGFEISKDNYMVAVSKVAYDGNFDNNKVRNVSILLQPRNNFSSSSTKEVFYTSYSEGSSKGCANPYLVKVSDNVFVLMWEDLDTSSASINNAGLTDTFEAVVIDGNGNKLSGIKTFTGALSDCKPIAYNGAIYWYGSGKSETNKWGYISSSESAPVFYELILSNSGSSYDLGLLRSDTDAGIYFGEDLTDEQKEQIKTFVVRFYKEVLGRDDAAIAADAEGVNDWTNKLITREKTGADVARGFAMSKEFQNKNLGNDVFLKTMYKAFFDREPDEGGYNGWMQKLNSGVSKEAVIAGFVNSKEFQNLCAKYGINPGSMEVSPEGQKIQQNTSQQSSQRPPLKLDASGVDKTQLDAFVERLYDKALGRGSDADGKEYWMKAIMDGHDDKGNVYDAAIAVRKGFFESKEYLNKGRNDDEFLTDLYWAFFNREPDAEGYAYWQNKMKNEGYSRQRVIDEGFGHSKEFKNLLTSYGFKILE